jgi:hypothetical protein
MSYQHSIVFFVYIWPFKTAITFPGKIGYPQSPTILFLGVSENDMYTLKIAT